MTRKHSHYFKPVPAGVTHIDIYRLLAMFEVTDQAVGHAVKKLLVAGRRGAKDERKDIQEAIDTLQRKLEIMGEDDQRPIEEKPPFTNIIKVRMSIGSGGGPGEASHGR